MAVLSNRDKLKAVNQKRKEERQNLMNSEPDNVITDLAKKAEEDMEELVNEEPIKEPAETGLEMKVGSEMKIDSEPSISAQVSNDTKKKENKKTKEISTVLPEYKDEPTRTTIYLPIFMCQEIEMIGKLADENQLKTEDGHKLNRAEFIRSAFRHEIDSFYEQYPKARDIIYDMIKEKREQEKERENKKKKRIL